VPLIAYQRYALGRRAFEVPVVEQYLYYFSSGQGATISRLSSISDSTGTLENYAYLGLGAWEPSCFAPIRCPE
jgi:hypothetical protein